MGDAHGMEGYRVVLNLNQDGRHLKASATDLEPFIGSHFPGQMRCYQDSRTLAYLNHQVLGPGLLEEIVQSQYVDEQSKKENKEIQR